MLETVLPSTNVAASSVGQYQDTLVISRASNDETHHRVRFSNVIDVLGVLMAGSQATQILNCKLKAIR